MNEKYLRYIESISVKGLFGLYDYELKVQDSQIIGNKMMILYGDNGSGKTTILKLLFHLLSPEIGEGHKSDVASTSFELFIVKLVDETAIIAKREEGQIIGSFEMAIKKPGMKEVSYSFVANSDNRIPIKDHKDKERYKVFLDELRKLGLGLYLLSNDRDIVLAGLETNPSIRYHSMRDDSYETNTILSARRSENITPEKIAQFLLKKSINRVESWIRSQAIRGSSLGESNVDKTYRDILSKLSKQTEEEKYLEIDKKAIEKRIRALEEKSTDFAKYKLMPSFDGKSILNIVKKASGEQFIIIKKVLDSYLQSREDKLKALDGIYRNVDNLVTVINRFLTDKSLNFNLVEGLEILSREKKPLDPSLLSSGERHLLLFFFNSLLAIEQPSIMMIDEPEISLNVTWQRDLLSSLLECIGDSPVQYIFATHSIELLSSHQNRLVQLKNLRNC